MKIGRISLIDPAVPSVKRESLETEIERVISSIFSTSEPSNGAAAPTPALFTRSVMFASVRKVYDAAMREMSTPELTRVLEAAIESHQPPLVSGRRIKLRYAHQGGRNPPVVVIHGNQVEHVPDAYRRYLVNVYRKAFDLMGTPVRVLFRGEENPFAGRKNPLTPRQIRSRKRLIRRNKR